VNAKVILAFVVTAGGVCCSIQEPRTERNICDLVNTMETIFEVTAAGRRVGNIPKHCNVVYGTSAANSTDHVKSHRLNYSVLDHISSEMETRSNKRNSKWLLHFPLLIQRTRSFQT